MAGKPGPGNRTLVRRGDTPASQPHWGDRWVRFQVSLKKFTEERREMGWIGQAASQYCLASGFFPSCHTHQLPQCAANPIEVSLERRRPFTCTVLNCFPDVVHSRVKSESRFQIPPPRPVSPLAKFPPFALLILLLPSASCCSGEKSSASYLSTTTAMKSMLGITISSGVRIQCRLFCSSVFHCSTRNLRAPSLHIFTRDHYAPLPRAHTRAANFRFLKGGGQAGNRERLG